VADRLSIKCPDCAGDSHREWGHVFEEKEQSARLIVHLDPVSNGALLTWLCESEHGSLGVQATGGVPEKK